MNDAHRKYDVYGIGNALVDTEYEVADPFVESIPFDKGVMTLIDQQQMTDLTRALLAEHQVVKRAGGGSAANTMVTAARLGSRSFYSCKVADDTVGEFFLADLLAAGVDSNLRLDNRPPGLTGECISMVTPDAERTMTTHLGITETLSENELNTDALVNAAYLYIEGYLVTSPTGSAAALAAQKLAAETGGKVSLTLSDPAIVEHFKPGFDHMLECGVDILFCNADEALLWSSATRLPDAVRTIREAVGAFAITLGAGGALVWNGEGEPHEVPGFSAKAVDTTGAGDSFAGAFLHAIAAGASFEVAAALANRTAALLVSHFGARLTQDQVTRELMPEFRHHLG